MIFTAINDAYMVPYVAKLTGGEVSSTGFGIGTYKVTTHPTAEGGLKHVRTPLGGIVFDMYMGNSICGHMAGTSARWATKNTLWAAMDYAFNKIKVAKIIGLVSGDNQKALELDLRFGYRETTHIEDAIAPGVDLHILELTRDDAQKWLEIKPDWTRIVLPQDEKPIIQMPTAQELNQLGMSQAVN
jgi:hypothetical protein